MIEIIQSEKTVAVRLTGRHPISDWHYDFEFACSDEAYARLLEHHFRTELWKQIRRIKRQAYELGHKDGRAKRRKKDYFSGRLESDTEQS